ncbi:hypothetical protein MNO14_13625 [Luteimonas sp. S4-F44]|uniref:hypothetical protein n=1 Tax=Luteimonas sp. S4-F44 TaxID=2925842 RepID=UPI001F52F373|nr:hypothetical protein [Luteimonas sp. S4-F44]UNK41979.1 hypothetical protein MNO14_13625 [Luteimonas sp. S4-F44]
MHLRVAAVLALVAAVVLGLAFSRADAPAAANRSRDAAPSGEGAVAALAPGAATKTRPRLGRVTRHVASQGPAATVPVSRRQAFERSQDLFALVQRLRPLAETGDAEARWLVSRIHEYCAGYARAPVDYARDTLLLASLPLPAARPLREARARIERRCGRFVADDAPSFVQLVEQRREAALAGSLPAEAALLSMGAPLADDEDYRRGLVDRVLESADPDAYTALAPAMGEAAAGDPALAGRVAGSQNAETAWHNAACSLGLDCSGDGALMTRYCAEGGICAQDESQDFSAFVREASPPQDAEQIEEMTAELRRDQQVGMVTK